MKKDRVAAKKAIQKFVTKSWLPWSAPSRYGQSMRAPVGQLSLFAAWAIRRAGLGGEVWPDDVAAALPLVLV